MAFGFLKKIVAALAGKKSAPHKQGGGKQQGEGKRGHRGG